MLTMAAICPVGAATIMSMVTRAWAKLHTQNCELAGKPLLCMSGLACRSYQVLT